MQVLTNLLQAVNDVLLAGELADGGEFICSDEGAKRLQEAYNAFLATVPQELDLLHEYVALAESLVEEFGPDTERVTREAFAAMHDLAQDAIAWPTAFCPPPGRSEPTARLTGSEAGAFVRTYRYDHPLDDPRPEGPEPIERWELRSGSVHVLGYRYDTGHVSEIETHFPRPVDPADWPDLPF